MELILVHIEELWEPTWTLRKLEGPKLKNLEVGRPKWKGSEVQELI